MSNDPYDKGFEEAMIPVRTDLTVLPADESGNKKLGWVVYEVEGTDAFLIPEDTPIPTTAEGVEALCIPENLIIEEDAIQKGQRLILTDFFGRCLGIVDQMPDGDFYAKSPGEKSGMHYMLKFVNDRPDPEPARWVCCGSFNVAAIQRLNLTP